MPGVNHTLDATTRGSSQANDQPARTHLTTQAVVDEESGFGNNMEYMQLIRNINQQYQESILRINGIRDCL